VIGAQFIMDYAASTLADESYDTRRSNYPIPDLNLIVTADTDIPIIYIQHPVITFEKIQLGHYTSGLNHMFHMYEAAMDAHYINNDLTSATHRNIIDINSPLASNLSMDEFLSAVFGIDDSYQIIDDSIDDDYHNAPDSMGTSNISIEEVDE
jgi:hypothetical protein